MISDEEFLYYHCFYTQRLASAAVVAISNVIYKLPAALNWILTNAFTFFFKKIIFTIFENISFICFKYVDAV